MKKWINRGAYKRKPQTEGSSIGFNIYQSVTTDPRFAHLKPVADALKAQRDAYEVANAKAVNGGTVLINEKNAAYVLFIAAIDSVADGVESRAECDENFVRATGFTPVKASESVSDLPLPKGLFVINDERSGSIKTGWQPEPNSITTVIETQIKGETTWQNGRYSTSSRNNIISGFAPGTWVNVRISHLGTRGLKSDYSDPVSVLVI